MLHAMGAQGNSGLVIAERIEPGDSGMLAEAPGGGGVYVCTCGCDCEDSPRPEVLARLGGGGLRIGHG